MTIPATVADLRDMQARYPLNAHFGAVCAAEIAAIDDPPRPVLELRPCPACGLPGGLVFCAVCHVPRPQAAEPRAHRHPCPEDDCPGVECFTTLEGCGGDGTRESACPMEVRRGEACPDLEAARP